MKAQLTFFEIKKDNKKNKKRNWENAFQRWSDKRNQDQISHYGKCDYGSMCDYCSDVSKGRPCVRALNLMLKETKKTIDYDKRNFEDIWNGDFENYL